MGTKRKEPPVSAEGSPHRTATGLGARVARLRSPVLRAGAWSILRANLENNIPAPPAEPTPTMDRKEERIQRRL